MYNRTDLRNPPYYMSAPESNKTDKRIFGLELEANDPHSWRAFTQAVDNNIIYLEGISEDYNRHGTHIAAKYDCTAQYELVYQAERPRNICIAVKSTEKYLNPNTVHNLNAGENGNRNDCSAHIHINNVYLDNKGIEYDEMVKASELLAPFLYVMSGRVNRYSGSMEWAQSILDNSDNHLCDIFAHPQVRAQYLDELQDEYRLTKDSHGHRYCIMNTPTHHDTSELRLFTNKCSFDYNRIKLFIETADFLIDIADKYQGIQYTDCYEEIVNDFRNFLLRYKRRREEVKKMKLDFIHQGVSGYNKFIFKNRNNTIHGLNENSIVDTLRAIRDIERNYGITYDKAINLASIDVEELKNYYMEKLMTNEELNVSNF